MSIAELHTSPNADAIMLELEKYDLVQHALELEAYGVTIVPREKLGVSKRWASKLRNAILSTCEKRNGVTIGNYRTSKATGENPREEFVVPAAGKRRVRGGCLESRSTRAYALAARAERGTRGPYVDY